MTDKNFDMRPSDSSPAFLAFTDAVVERLAGGKELGCEHVTAPIASAKSKGRPGILMCAEHPAAGAFCPDCFDTHLLRHPEAHCAMCLRPEEWLVTVPRLFDAPSDGFVVNPAGRGMVTVTLESVIVLAVVCGDCLFPGEVPQWATP